MEGQPTMKVRVPAEAPMTPPDMGASMKVVEAGARAATQREVEGSMVEWSIRRRGVEGGGEVRMVV